MSSRDNLYIQHLKKEQTLLLLQAVIVFLAGVAMITGAAVAVHHLHHLRALILVPISVAAILVPYGGILIRLAWRLNESRASLGMAICYKLIGRHDLSQQHIDASRQAKIERMAADQSFWLRLLEAVFQRSSTKPPPPPQDGATGRKPEDP